MKCPRYLTRLLWRIHHSGVLECAFLPLAGCMAVAIAVRVGFLWATVYVLCFAVFGLLREVLFRLYMTLWRPFLHRVEVVVVGECIDNVTRLARAHGIVVRAFPNTTTVHSAQASSLNGPRARPRQTAKMILLEPLSRPAVLVLAFSSREDLQVALSPEVRACLAGVREWRGATFLVGPQETRKWAEGHVRREKWWSNLDGHPAPRVLTFMAIDDVLRLAHLPSIVGGMR